MKISNKTQFSGRRRSSTRKSGFSVGDTFHGTRLRQENIKGIEFSNKLSLKFSLDGTIKNQWVGFGLYHYSNKELEVDIINPNFKNFINNNYGPNIWSKLGSIWIHNGKIEDIIINFKIKGKANIYFYNLQFGLVEHDFLDIDNPLWENRNSDIQKRRKDFLDQTKNLHTYAPEALFIVQNFNATFSNNKKIKKSININLKNCNRCERFLPVNLEQHERDQLSYSNHCGESKGQCVHSSFGRILDERKNELKQLRYGFQLECRFCKKFAVNAALNPLRTSAQLKEDGQRRRHFELLLTELYDKSPMLMYRHLTNKELVDDIFDRFEGKCFKCKTQLSLTKKINKINLDHTRPLALLWQLDGTATALCKNCNSQKSDKYPKDFYTDSELLELSKITNISLDDLKNPSPNEDALKLLIESIDWFFDDYLSSKEELFIEKDGKISAELICKAIDKVIKQSSNEYEISFINEFNKRFVNA